MHKRTNFFHRVGLFGLLAFIILTPQVSRAAVAIPVPLVCTPGSQTVLVGQTAFVSATGGIGAYDWSASDATTTTGTGANFSTSYSTTGSKSIEVTSDTQTTVCSVTVQAVSGSGISVLFEQTPLFAEGNFAPGNTVSRFITVTNNNTTQKTAAIEAINQDDGDDLASQIDLAITEDGDEVFAGTLREFFDDGERALTPIPANGGTTQYILSATFNPDTGNDFQGKTLGFDLIVGFLGTGGGQGDFETPPGGSGGGGGGGGTVPEVPSGLSIPENGIYVTDVTATSAIVHWSTSYAATSQVIYAAEGESYSFSITQPNFGYPKATTEDPNKVTTHAVLVTELTPLTKYYFRVVSHASPATISFQHDFVTLPVGQQTSPITIQPTGTVAGDATTRGGVTEANFTFGADSLGSSQENEGENANTTQGIVLGEQDVTSEEEPCKTQAWWWAGYIIILLLLVLASRPLSDNVKLAGTVSAVGAVATLLWWYYTPCGNREWDWLALTLTAITVTLFIPKRNHTKQ